LRVFWFFLHLRGLPVIKNIFNLFIAFSYS
jgi:hypothetical protein